MARSHLVGREPVASRRGGSEVLDQHVGAVAELEETVPAVGVVQVERDAALVRVAIQERQRAVGRRCVAGERGPQATRIAGRRLDLEHVGAEVGQHAAGERAAQVGQLDDAHVGQRARASLGHPIRARPGYFQPATWYPRSARHWFT